MMEKFRQNIDLEEIAQSDVVRLILMHTEAKGYMKSWESLRRKVTNGSQLQVADAALQLRSGREPEIYMSENQSI